MKTVHSQNGIAMVETAIVLPLLLALTFGIVSLGQILFVKLVASDSLRSAGHAASLSTAENCLDDARFAYNKKMEKFQAKLLVDSNTGKPIHDLSLAISNSLDGQKIMLLTSKIRPDCAACGFLNAFFNFSPRIESTYSFPVENVDSICTVPMFQAAGAGIQTP